MKDMITTIASIMILMIFVLQFVTNQNIVFDYLFISSHKPV